MKVFLPIATSQELKVRPRKMVTSVNLVLRQESTDSVITYPLTGTYSGGFLILSLSHDFEEGEGYEMVINDSSDNLLWRGRAFATAQEPSKYKLNDGILTV